MQLPVPLMMLSGDTLVMLFCKEQKRMLPLLHCRATLLLQAPCWGAYASWSQSASLCADHHTRRMTTHRDLQAYVKRVSSIDKDNIEELRAMAAEQRERKDSHSLAQHLAGPAPPGSSGVARQSVQAQPVPAEEGIDPESLRRLEQQAVGASSPLYPGSLPVHERTCSKTGQEDQGGMGIAYM